ncbi:hypothetical protein [Paraburkholderia sp. CI3]|uniref:hypothetical protein n=1 Tax=Paraburkholderia sp. CI3 TaxID=2991060 RepID=UPI003D25DBE2
MTWLSLLVAAVAIGGLLAYGYRQWARSTGSNFEFYASLLAFNATALLLLTNALCWFEYMSNVINVSHPLCLRSARLGFSSDLRRHTRLRDEPDALRDSQPSALARLVRSSPR